MKRLLFVLGALAASCGGANVDLAGKSAEEVGETVAAAICDKECDEIHLDCSAGSSGEATCTGSLTPFDEVDCIADNETDYATMWDCANADQKTRLETCVNDQLDVDCPTQEDAEAFAESASGDGSSESDYQIPPSCSVVFELFDCEPAS